MNMKLLVLFLFVNINISFCQKQSFVVNYFFKIQTSDGGSAEFYKILKTNENASIFLDSGSVVTKGGKSQLIQRDKKLDNGLYFDRVNDVSIYFSPIYGKSFYVKEDNATLLFTWTLVDSLKKTILSFNCKAATCNFRGRSYIAYYTEEVPLYAGPWKFSGLPGLILEIKTTDDKYGYEAYRLSSQDKQIEIINPYKNVAEAFLSFKEHKKIFLKKLTDTQNKLITDEKEKDVELKITDNSMEL